MQTPHTLQIRISERRLLLMLGDVVATVVAVVVALRLWALQAHKAFTPEFVQPQFIWFLVLPALWLVLANADDYYNLLVAARLRSSIKRLVLITGQVLAIYLATFFLSPRGSLPRRFIVYYAVVSLVLIGLWRACRLFLLGWSGFRRRTVIVGTGQAAELIWRTVKEEAAGDYEIVGAVISVEEQSSRSEHIPVLGTVAELPALVQAHGVSELIMAYLNEMPGDAFQGVMACYEQGVAVTPMPALYEEITGRVPIESVGEHLWPMVLPLEMHTLSFRLYLALKRAADIAASLVGLVVFALLLPPLALAIKLDSRGPVFYRQERVGQGGRTFIIWKLRSMIAEAEHGTGPRWADASDPRMTRVGKALRKSRLDELPQLMNILRGEMSLIGPRPERPEFVSFLATEIPFYRARLVVKPGLTGWAQVRFRYGNSIEDVLRKLQYDLYYVRHQSLLLDVAIVVKTVGTVLTLRGT